MRERGFHAAEGWELPRVATTPPLRKRPNPFGESARRLDSDSLLALVVPTGSTSAVGPRCFTTVRAGDDLNGSHLVVVGATHVTLRGGRFSLGDSHGKLL